MISNLGSFCKEASDILQFVGWILTAFKIAVPLLIIAYGIFDFGKAVTAQKDDEIKKSVKSLAYRAAAGVIIFFIPTIVMWLFGLIGGYTDAKNSSNFKVCESCVLTPWNCN